MARDRNSDHQDRVIPTHSEETALYRIFAVEPHGWSTVLLEDRDGGIHLCSTTAAALTAIAAEEAELLLKNRSYRRWHGQNDWSPLDRLPLVSSIFAEPVNTGSETSV